LRLALVPARGNATMTNDDGLLTETELGRNLAHAGKVFGSLPMNPNKQLSLFGFPDEPAQFNSPNEAGLQEKRDTWWLAMLRGSQSWNVDEEEAERPARQNAPKQTTMFPER